MSYAREDSRFVLRLVGQLQLLGANVFIDQQDIGAGERWNQVLENELRASKGVLVALSSRSVVSEFVRRELIIALESKIPIVPLLIADTAIPEELQALEYIDFRRGYADAISKILKALQLDTPHGMHRIYVSHDLDKKRVDLIEVIAQILFAHGIQAVIERRATNAAKTEKQLAALTSCDALLSILSRSPGSRGLKQIQAELQHCDDTGKRNLVIPYAGIPTTSFSRGRELYTYSARKQIQFAIDLSSEIAGWKHQLGGTVKALLQLIGRPGHPSSLESSRVFYRTWSKDRASGWAETPLIREPGAITAFLRGVRNDQLIEVRLDEAQTSWKSEISAQVLYLELQRTEDST